MTFSEEVAALRLAHPDQQIGPITDAWYLGEDGQEHRVRSVVQIEPGPRWAQSAGTQNECRMPVEFA